MEQKIEYDLIGIAEILARHRLRVPPNQREYSWEEEQVLDLIQDISNALDTSRTGYFLGTIVLTQTDSDILEIADGQQRLATVTIILSQLRRYWVDSGNKYGVRAVEDCLFRSEPREQAIVPRLTLNLDDNLYFKNLILEDRDDRNKTVQGTRRSHALISGALNCVREHFEGMKRQLRADHFDSRLNDWLEYLRKEAKVVKFSVPSSANAFIMFETLNDRGLKTSQADIVKNYLFRQIGDEQGPEAQQYWSAMRGAIESVTDEDVILDFLRLSCCVLYGHTKEREIMDRIQSKVQGRTSAMIMLSTLKELSAYFAAILNPDHPKWAEYNPSVRRSIATLNYLGVKQVRSLMLAVARKFDKRQTASAFKSFVSWSVRFLIMGERGSKLDEGYAGFANDVFDGEIESYSELVEAAVKNSGTSIIPGDAEFEDQFEKAKVGKSPLARYYLRSLEMTAQGLPEPEFIPNDDTVVTLEHVLPKEPLPDEWPAITARDVETHCARLGNLALLKAGKNSDLGNCSFEKKKPAYRDSMFVLTNQIAEMPQWTIREIEDRQIKLAELAVRTWPSEG